MRDTKSTLLPPVVLRGELATLGRVTRTGEAGQSYSSALLEDPPGRAIPGSPGRPVRPQGRSGSAPLAGCRGPGRGGARRAFPGEAARLRQVRRRGSQVGICSQVRRLGSQRRALPASPPTTLRP